MAEAVNVRIIEGDWVAPGANFAIVAARFNGLVVNSLVEAAIDTLKRHGVEDKRITLIRAPGAFELPLVAGRVAPRFDAVIALGAVIRGDTPHFDQVAGAAAAGLAEVARTSGKPVAFGVLTTDNIEQAMERAGTKAGNKGADAAMTALEMVSLLRRLREAGGEV